MNDIDPRLHERMSDEPKPVPTPEVAPEPEPSSKILIWAIAIIGILLIAIFAIRAVYNPVQRGETTTYNNFEFENVGGLWQTLWEAEQGTQLIVAFHYTPQETLNITPNVLASWDSQRFTENADVVIAIDPTIDYQPYVQVAASELSFKMRSLGNDISAGYTRNATGDFPERDVVSCKTPNRSVIIIQDVNVTAGVQLQDTCVTIYGYREELVRAVDRFLYSVYGIIPSLSTTE